jgi:aryl-alcohol dehydrogenase-like predicted oxidoreductase
MATIREWQQEGRIHYNGITHWEDRALPDLEAAMLKHEPQFVQIHYNLGERAVEERILPLAKDLGTAVLINRPYMHGKLFAAIAGQQLPDWATEFAASWGQFFLKFIVSHPAVNCAIPATSKLEHLEDNLGAGYGPLPDAATRARMVRFIESV